MGRGAKVTGLLPGRMMIIMSVRPTPHPHPARSRPPVTYSLTKTVILHRHQHINYAIGSQCTTIHSIVVEGQQLWEMYQ